MDREFESGLLPRRVTHTRTFPASCDHSSRSAPISRERGIDLSCRIDEERYSLGIDEALDLLRHFRNSAPPNYEREHKGVPFYIMGYAAFASHDYSAASVYFDAAVAERLIPLSQVGQYVV